ncbi:MAG: hypothetical protein QXI19_10655 [Candidatus Caldarchaeum sp.]
MVASADGCAVTAAYDLDRRFTGVSAHFALAMRLLATGVSNVDVKAADLWGWFRTTSGNGNNFSSMATARARPNGSLTR